MGAHLHDSLVAACGLDHATAFVDSHRKRFLHVHVLAAVAGGDALDRMPVVGRGDHHRVEILAIEQLAEIGQRLGAAVDLGVGLFQCRLVHVAKGDDLHVGVRQEGVHQLAAPVSHADASQPDTVVGSQDLAGLQSGQAQCGGFGEGAASEAGWRHGEDGLSIGRGEIAGRRL
jgi:hypothetical protein